jgi:hypothetical protein
MINLHTFSSDYTLIVGVNQSFIALTWQKISIPLRASPIVPYLKIYGSTHKKLFQHFSILQTFIRKDIGHLIK